jgi:C_GCAxxG_C_C family probable redox protein
VLLAIAESQGIQSDLIPRIATGFCSGISRTGGMCGAVSGAIMGINLVAGRNSPDESIEPSYTLTQKLINRLEGQYGSGNCRQLIGCDLATEAGQRYFMENHLMERYLQCAADATSMAVSLIAESHYSRTTRSVLRRLEVVDSEELPPDFFADRLYYCASRIFGCCKSVAIRIKRNGNSGLNADLRPRKMQKSN